MQFGSLRAEPHRAFAFPAKPIVLCGKKGFCWKCSYVCFFHEVSTKELSSVYYLLKNGHMLYIQGFCQFLIFTYSCTSFFVPKFAKSKQIQYFVTFVTLVVQKFLRKTFAGI